jgi:hypothetical protein
MDQKAQFYCYRNGPECDAKHPCSRVERLSADALFTLRDCHSGLVQFGAIRVGAAGEREESFEIVQRLGGVARKLLTLCGTVVRAEAVRILLE